MFFDVTMEINEDMMVYKNKEDKKPKFIERSNHITGNHYETSIMLDSHTGTHIDAPLHMIKDGDNLSYLKLENLIRECRVLDFSHIEDSINKEDLISKNIKSTEFILLKTKNSLDNEFNPKFIYLRGDGAQYLSSLGICGVGIDSLGIERDQPNYVTHKTLLEKKIIIIEGLRLKDVSEGKYKMIALPLKITVNEGVPARVILERRDNLT